MIALSIIGGILLFLLLLLTVRIHLLLDLDGDLRLRVRVLCFRFRIHPRKRTPRGVIRQQRKQEKKLKKKLANKQKPQKENKEISEKTAPKKKKTDILALIRLVIRILKQIARKFPSYFKLKIKRCIIKVGGKDAAEAAIRYGAVRAGVSALATVADSCFTVKTTRKSVLTVDPDFLSDKSSISLSMDFYTSVRAVLALALRILFAFLRRPKKNTTSQTSDTREITDITEKES